MPYYALPGHIFSTYAKHEEPNSLIFTGTLRCSVCKKKKLSQCSVKVRGWNDLAKYLLEFHTNSVQQMEHWKKPSGSRCTTCNSNSHCLFPIEAAILGPQFNPSAYKQEKYNLPTLDMENLSIRGSVHISWTARACRPPYPLYIPGCGPQFGSKFTKTVMHAQEEKGITNDRIGAVRVEIYIRRFWGSVLAIVLNISKS